MPIERDPALRHTDTGGLLRILGLGFAVAVVVGGVIGQGILRMPGLVATGLPDARLILLAWILGGLLALIDSMSTIELATSVQRAGGPYTFAKRAFGQLSGFIVGCSDWLANTAALGFIAVAFAEFCHRLGIAQSWPLGVLAVALISTCGLINWIGTRASGLSQKVGSALKALALTALIIALLVAEPGEGAGIPALSDPLPALTLVGIVLAARAVRSTYNGWNTIAYFSEEVRSADRNIARATFIGLGLVTLIYVMTNLALVRVLPVDAIAASTLPVADAAAQVFGTLGAPLVTALALLSVGAIANLQPMFLSRIVYQMAQDRLMPPIFARVAASGTPRPALLLSIITAAIFASTGVYERLVAMWAVLSAFTYVLVNLSAIRLRQKEPDLPRPYSMPLYPLPAALALAVNLALAIGLLLENPAATGYTLLLLFAPVPVYLIVRRRWSLAAQAVRPLPPVS